MITNRRLFVTLVDGSQRELKVYEGMISNLTERFPSALFAGLLRQDDKYGETGVPEYKTTYVYADCYETIDGKWLIPSSVMEAWWEPP